MLVPSPLSEVFQGSTLLPNKLKILWAETQDLPQYVISLLFIALSPVSECRAAFKLNSLLYLNPGTFTLQHFDSRLFL